MHSPALPMRFCPVLELYDRQLSPAVLCIFWTRSRERTIRSNEAEDRGTRVGGESLCSCWLKGTCSLCILRHFALIEWPQKKKKCMCQSVQTWQEISCERVPFWIETGKHVDTNLITHSIHFFACTLHMFSLARGAAGNTSRLFERG